MLQWEQKKWWFPDIKVCGVSRDCSSKGCSSGSSFFLDPFSIDYSSMSRGSSLDMRWRDIPELVKLGAIIFSLSNES